MKVEVTQEDIDLGIRGANDRCAIARAIQRKGHRSVRVGRAYITFITSESEYNEHSFYVTPKKASEFIKRFDHMDAVKPFTFVMRKS